MKALGALGGKATVARHGQAHMATIGKLGWAGLVKKYGRERVIEMLSEAGNKSAFRQLQQWSIDQFGGYNNLTRRNDGKVVDELDF
jgi:hypothetical protein